MKDAGYAHMGVGRAEGKDKAIEAAKSAVASPLLETTIDGARGVLINITASPDIDLEDVELASGEISRMAHPDANIIWGAAFDENMDDCIAVTVIATGFTESDKPSKNDDLDVNDFIRKVRQDDAPAAPATPGAVVTPPAQNNDDYLDIMTIFNKKKD